MKAMNVSLWSGIAWLGCSVLALGQNGYKFDAATVSGLAGAQHRLGHYERPRCGGGCG